MMVQNIIFKMIYVPRQLGNHWLWSIIIYDLKHVTEVHLENSQAQFRTVYKLSIRTSLN